MDHKRGEYSFQKTPKVRPQTVMEEAEDLDIALDISRANEDSGSAYEEQLSDAQPSSSEDERILPSRPPSAASQRERGRSRGRKPRVGSSTQGGSLHERGLSSLTDEKIRADALQWASSFQEPVSLGDIKSPTRHTPTRSKRKADRPASEIRAKRLKGFYNNDYRELLNTVIHETAARTIPDEYTPLPGSQIGSSIWTGEEKDTFFSALSRLGRHDSRGIALRIQSKSKLEVQDYINLLHQGLRDRTEIHQELLDFTDLPAAFEITEGCSDLLERAGDVLASRQECAAEEKEKAKWGDLWLLTPDVCKLLQNQRKDDGEQSEEGSLPAADLLDLKKWLELPQKIFMNSAEPREEDNWQSLAEPGERPAIRATAFEDFHSLAVSITKRLVSTALFCSTSRRRAAHSMGVQQAEVNLDDVEAAIKILGLKENSLEFWVGSARRLCLDVFDTDEDAGSEVDLTYDEVEATLRQTRRRSRSRSRSMSRQPRSEKSVTNVDGGSDQDEPTDHVSEDARTDDNSSYDEESDIISNPSLEDDEFTDLSEGQINTRISRLQEAREIKAAERKEFRRTQEAYIEAFDNNVNQVEETRLWKLLRQSPPPEIKLEPLEIPDAPNHSTNKTGIMDWRDTIEYWSSWETHQTPVPEESFVKNRNRRTRKGWARLREASSEHDLSRARSLIDEEEKMSLDESRGDNTSAESTEEEAREIQGGEILQESKPHADVRVNDEDNIDLQSPSHSENNSSQPQSPMFDAMFDDDFGFHFPRSVDRGRISDEEIPFGDYDD